MVPASFVVRREFPITSAGKIDRRALPAPEHQPPIAHIYVAPRTPIEQAAADIWGAVLAREPIGIHDNFFTLGGHSLLAAQLIHRMNAAFEIQLTLRHLFESPTIAELAIAIGEQQSHTPHVLPAIAPVPHGQLIAASYAQEWIVAHDQPQMTINSSVLITSTLDIRSLERTLSEL